MPPNFFAKDVIFSITLAVGKPVIVDMAMRNLTRPSWENVKIEVDLIAKLPERVRINHENNSIGEIKSKLIKI